MRRPMQNLGREHMAQVFDRDRLRRFLIGCAVFMLVTFQSVTRATDRVWFSPLPPPPPAIPDFLPQPGAADYWDLFYDDAPWATAMNRVGVFQFIAQTLDIATDEQLSHAIAFLQRHDMKIAVEMGPINMPAGCNGTEGFGGIDRAIHVSNRVRFNGGVIDYVVMDEPFYYAHTVPYPGCSMTPEALADNVASTAGVFKSIFPNIKIGEVEPFQNISPVEIYTPYKNYLDRFQAVTGTKMAFVHNEGNMELPIWQERHCLLLQVLNERQIPHGIIRNGMQASAHSEAEWFQAAKYRIDVWRVVSTFPDHNIFQSWDGWPTRLLPESSPTAYTNLINYMGVRQHFDSQTDSYHPWPGGYFYGWSLDLSANYDSGIDWVQVYDYGPAGPAYLGQVNFYGRWDVAYAYGFQYLNAGWYFQIPPLSAGEHTVCFFPHSSVIGKYEWSATQCTAVHGG